MSRYQLDIKPFGKKAILVEWPTEVCDLILNDILEFEIKLKKSLVSGTEFIVAYNSLAIVYNSPIDFLDEEERLQIIYKTSKTEMPKSHSHWKFPVCYDEVFGIDLVEVSKSLKQTKKDLIKLHTESRYTVYGIGFLPGFMYLGGLPAELEITRRETPRLRVRAGSVGLAGKQTGIYPQESPGGWNIIGNCPTPIFNTSNEPPCFVSVGDVVQFYEISKSEYDLMKIEIEVGLFKFEDLENA